MSTSGSREAQDLTRDEQILHHHAAIVKRDLEVYHANSKSQGGWRNLFRDRLRKSINFHFRASNRNSNITIRIHPLLLSLCETFNVSDINPDIGSISENDERVLTSSFYTSPSALPLLEIHFSGKNVNCRECMASVLQDYSKGESNATQWNSAALERQSEKSSQESRKRDREAEPYDITLVEGLKDEVQALKTRCNMLEENVKDLQSVCDTHQRSLETFRQHIIDIHRHQGTLDMSYQGEEFEVML